MSVMPVTKTGRTLLTEVQLDVLSAIALVPAEPVPHAELGKLGQREAFVIEP